MWFINISTSVTVVKKDKLRFYVFGRIPPWNAFNYFTSMSNPLLLYLFSGKTGKKVFNKKQIKTFHGEDLKCNRIETFNGFKDNLSKKPVFAFFEKNSNRKTQNYHPKPNPCDSFE